MADHELTSLVRDQFLASYLLALKNEKEIIMVGYNFNSNGILEFEFSPRLKVEQLIQDFFALKAKPIQPKLLCEGLREFRSILSSQRDRR